jgi:hypothetical protein
MITKSQTAELLQSRAFRRALAFMIGVGVAAGAGVWLRQSGGLLVGVITAMMFSFADDEGSLARRFTALGRTAAGIAIGGAIGHMLGGYGPLFWILFVGGAFAAAWLNRSGKTAHIGARLAVMALTIAAGTPELSRSEVLFVAGSLVVVVLVRLADHALFGPLPAWSLPAPQAVSADDRFWLRFAAAYATVATLALWLGLTIDPQHTIWVVVTVLVVMQPDERSNYRRIFERIIGTVAGVLAAFVWTHFLKSEAASIAALLLTASVLPHHIPLRYWLHTAAIALLVMLTYDLASQVSQYGLAFAPGLFKERLIDVFAGCALALVGTEIGFRWGAKAQPGAEPQN